MFAQDAPKAYGNAIQFEEGGVFDPAKRTKYNTWYNSTNQLLLQLGICYFLNKLLIITSPGPNGGPRCRTLLHSGFVGEQALNLKKF